MAFTPAQQAQAAQQIQAAIDLLTNAKTTVLNSLGGQFPATTQLRAACQKVLDTLLICGAALED